MGPTIASLLAMLRKEGWRYKAGLVLSGGTKLSHLRRHSIQCDLTSSLEGHQEPEVEMGIELSDWGV